ncbi:MAG: DUF389 domain-containing protein [Arenimonas sp.]
MKKSIFRMFDLLSGQADSESIDASIRERAIFGGANLWVLFFAILVASVGLNVNSTAVIIGAMLISPLMGPILGVGYGAGIGDTQLIKSSARSFFLFVIISLITATIYFFLSPLDKAQSELLARTSPTIWDVMIAFFGGCAGIVAITRKEVSTVVPGVAIATALMPPLCTAGFGIANGNAQYFFGAFYLFTINTVFIAFSTLLFTKILRLAPRGMALDATHRKTRVWVAAAVILTVAPSGYLTLQLLRNEVFENTISSVLNDSETSSNLLILDRKVNAAERRVDLTIGGERPSQDVAIELGHLFAAAGIKDVDIQVRFSGSDRVDVSALKQELQRDVYQNTVRQLNEQSAKADLLAKQLALVLQDKKAQSDVMQELFILFPQIKSVTVAKGVSKVTAESALVTDMLFVNLQVTGTEEFDPDRIKVWLGTKFPLLHVQVNVQPATTNESETPTDKVDIAIRNKSK